MRIVLDLQGAQSESRFRGIGRYTLALAEAIAREPGQHEIVLALSGRFPESTDPLRARFANLVPAERIRVSELPGPVAETDLANTWRMQAAELLREKFLADLRPDVVHVSTLFEGIHNEVVASVGRLDRAMPTAVTLYDLIPILHPENYLSNALAKRAYLRRAQSLKRAELLLAISRSTAQEAIDTLDISPSRIVTIGAGVNPWFRQTEITPDAKGALMARCGLQRPFLLYAGLADSRKNLERLIVAFALLPEQLRTTYQLAIVGKVHEENRKRLLSLGQEHGLNNAEVVCVGYVSDDDMRLLYNSCALFVLPSLHEGFGLPLLEAMACGAPVIGSEYSIPEIIDRSDALFDPQRPEEIANRMGAVLSNAELRQSLKIWGSARAKAFTWQSCARKALEAFEALYERRNATNAVTVSACAKHRPLLAFVSPLPPEQTAIADYSATLLPNLARHYEIVCIVDQSGATDGWLAVEFPIRNLLWFERNAGSFERILYHLNNSLSCKHMFAVIERYPGVVVLHDFYLGEVLNWMDHSRYMSGIFTKALYDSHGFSALVRDRLNGREASIRAFPCNAAVLRSSVGTIVPCESMIELARGWYGAGASNLMRRAPIVPHNADPPQIFADLQEVNRSQLQHVEQIASLYRDVIEEFYDTSSVAREQTLLRAIARTSTPALPSDSDLSSVATLIAANRERLGPRQMLVDVSWLAESDVRTGIQRVTRAILLALINDPPPGYRIEPIRAVGGAYVYARRFACQSLALPDGALTDDPVETGRDDIFLGLDLSLNFVPALKPWFLRKRQHGMQIVFVVYDLLPLLRPEYFLHFQLQPVFLEWLNTIAEVADGMVCISRAVADELHAWLAKSKARRLQSMWFGFFHLGADLRASLPSKGQPEDALAITAGLRSRPSFLMVGTLEPRKGYRQVIAAIEQLWAAGVDTNLVIVGQQGWDMEDLAKWIREHPENNKRLFWLEGISDEMLEQVYRSAHALLAASECEGFGLPLIEAAHHGLSIIARDIPVFREVAGEYAYYFHGEDPQDLADALRNWLSLGDAVPASSKLPRLTWQQSSRQLLEAVLGDRRITCWPDANHLLKSANAAVR